MLSVIARYRLTLAGMSFTLAVFPLSRGSAQVATTPSDTLVISYKVPTDTTDPKDLEKSAIYAWNEFIALTWPAKAQGPGSYPREAPDTTRRYGQVGSTGQVVWETFRHKVEIFPAPNDGKPNGYALNAPDYGYDSAPAYNYAIPITADSGKQGTTTPFNNLDESTEIILNIMHAGVVKPRSESSPTATDQKQKVLFQAKANRVMYKYAVKTALNAKGEFSASQNRQPYVKNASDNFMKNDPAQFALPYTQLPLSNTAELQIGTIEVKAAFRRLGANEDATKFYTPPVRYYTGSLSTSIQFIDSNNPNKPEKWGLIALHIIHKTPNSPSFSYATFGQVNNFLDANGNDVETPDGTTKPQYENVEPFAPGLTITPSQNGQPQKITLNGIGTVDTNSFRLYYRNVFDTVIRKQDGTPYLGPVNLNRRLFPIPAAITQVNARAHQLIKGTVWENYRLVNIQARALDISRDASTIQKEQSTYYLSNEVVESNATLQHFRGGLANSGIPGVGGKGAALDQENMYQLEKGQIVRFNMGGCMGCHGPQGQKAGGDFSVIFSRHLGNASPETVDEQEDEMAKRLFTSGKYIR